MRISDWSSDVCSSDLRARTWDPLIKSQLLYQLSYASIAVPAWPDPVGSAPGSTSPGGGQNENAALKALPESQLGSASPRLRSPAAAPRLIERPPAPDPPPCAAAPSLRPSQHPPSDLAISRRPPARADHTQPHAPAQHPRHHRRPAPDN